MEELTFISELLDNQITRVCIILIIASLTHLLVRGSISKLVRKAVRGHRHHSKEEEKKREDTLASMFRKVVGAVIWVVAVVLVLSELKVNLAAVLTGAGFLGVVIGFGAQKSIGDFMAGAFIILENQFRVGDIVNLRVSGSDVAGIAEEITIRITKLRDLDGQLHFIPNGSIEFVTNMTFQYAGVNLDVGVSYDADIDKVELVMNKVGSDMAKAEPWADKIVEPVEFLRLDSFDDSAVKVKALGKVKAGTQWEVAGEYRRRLKKAFEKEGIGIPFPQRVIHQAKK